MGHPDNRHMDDMDIFDRINALSGEEERLYAEAGDGEGLSGESVERLKAINVELDRAYDLLHQRQAKRNAGEDHPRRMPGPQTSSKATSSSATGSVCRQARSPLILPRGIDKNRPECAESASGRLVKALSSGYNCQ